MKDRSANLFARMEVPDWLLHLTVFQARYVVSVSPMCPCDIWIQPICPTIINDNPAPWEMVLDFIFKLHHSIAYYYNNLFENN